MPAFFEWLLRSSGQAAVLTILILVAQACLGKRLDGRWRHLLWFLVIVRLVLPWSPSSPVSLFNYVKFGHPPARQPVAQPAPIRVAVSDTPPVETSLQPLPRFVPTAAAPATPIAVPAKPRWTFPGWPALLMAVWAAGTGLLVVRLIVQNALFRRRLHSATPTNDQRLLQLFADCRAAMRVSRRVEVIESGLVGSPAIYGLFRLRLLLPPRLADHFSPAEIRHIFLHELGHVRRQDLAVQWLVTFLQILHWFNPVLWFAFRRMAADRELACDELALSVVGEGEGPDYGRTIVKLLEGCVPASPFPGSVGILEDKGQIFRRVAMIAAFQRHSRWSVVGAFALLVLGLATLTRAQAEKPSTDARQVADSATGAAHVSSQVDQKVAAIIQDWESLPSVFDDIETYAGQVRELVRIGKPAVPALCAALDRTDRDTTMRLLGFTLRAIGDPRAVPSLIHAVPKTLLPPGSDCGVFVTNRDLGAFMAAHDLGACQDPRSPASFGMGRPVREICGALAKITGTHVDETEIYNLFLEGGDQQRAVERRAFQQVAERWAAWWKDNRQRLVSDPTLADVQLPAAEPTPVASQFQPGTNARVSDGIDGVIVAPMESGRDCCLSLVLNHAMSLPPSLAVSNAAVALDRVTAWAAKAGVDLLGVRYPDPVSGNTYYAVRTAGLQAWEIPNERWSTIENDLQHTNLPALDQPAGDLLLHYDTKLARYEPQRRATFLFTTRDGFEGILRVTGQVVRNWTDSELGIPLSGDDGSPDQHADAGPYPGAKLDYKFFYNETEQLKLEAKTRKEHAEARTRERQARKIAALLKKYPRISGTVRLPDGQPATNAEVLVLTAGQAAIISNRRFPYSENAALVVTHDDGGFVIPKIPGARAFVAQENGFRQVDLADVQSPLVIQLASWGRIAGTATLEGKLAPHQTLALLDTSGFYSSPEPRLSDSASVESDDQGRFVFDGVPPGEVRVSRLVGRTYYDEQMVNVVAGETTICNHGFNGRILRGRLVASDATKVSDWKSGMSLSFSTKWNVPPVPANTDAETWAKRYWQSAEGRQTIRTTHNFAAQIEPDGNFQVEDVPPGNYELEADLHDGGGTGPFFTGKTLGQLHQDVKIPAGTGAPLDLGSFVMQMEK